MWLVLWNINQRRYPLHAIEGALYDRTLFRN